MTPALAWALSIVVTGQMARELGSGRTARLVVGVVARFCLKFMAIRSLFSMDVLDHLWRTLANFILPR